MKINTWNEWDPLEEVIVGTAENAAIPFTDNSVRAINYANQEIPNPQKYPKQVIEETEEDLSILCNILKRMNIKVYRPNPPKSQKFFGNSFWEANNYHSYCPRDSVLTYGNYIIETPMPIRSRFFETYSYRDIFMSAKAKWISAPKPMLLNENYNLEKIDKDTLTLKEIEPCFDAANILKCGSDLFYLVSNSGNKLGAKWLKNILPGCKIHLLENIYSFMHLDSTISFLRPGLVLLNPERINEKNIPKPLKKWNKIWCDDPIDIGYYGSFNHASPWINMNLLMVRPDLAIVEKNQIPLIKQLEKYKIDTIQLDLRHARTLGGGFHCVTLDLRRAGKKENYF